MASRKKTEPPLIEVKELTRADIDRGIGKLRRRIEDVRALDPTALRFDDAKVVSVQGNIRETIRDVFGTNSPEFHDHQYHHIWHGGINLFDGDEAMQGKFGAGIPQTATMLEGLIFRLDERREDASPDVVPSAPPRKSLASDGRAVFVVHGRDDGAKEAVARFLEKLTLKPLILHEQPNKGRTLIEKFETNAEADFAVVLLTPDDEGHPVGLTEEKRPRARQNVLFELGYFIGRIGRARVCALHKGGVELPSDFDGIVYVSMDDPQGWRLLLAREIKAAGIGVDLNLAM